MKIKVCGFDAAFRNFGIALAEIDVDMLDIKITGLHLIKTKRENRKQVLKSSDDIRCVREIHSQVTELVKDCAFAISEVPSGSKSASANRLLGMATAIIALCPVPLIEVSPMEVKVATTGKKTAGKDEMIDWVVKRHPHAPWLTYKRNGQILLSDANEHLADAAATIYAGVKTQQFQQALAMFKSMRPAA
jgi:Holliday junction resolvasome RuvABC endonuclease subunit